MPTTILVVDDEPMIRELVETFLDDEGFAVHTACDGAEALTHQAGKPADLILSDVAMPVVDGDDLVDELRRRGDQTPVVLMSGGACRRSKRPGVCFIPKPFELDTLLALVRLGLADGLHAV